MTKETKSEAFVRLAEARTNKAISSILNIGSLSNRNNYEYSAEQVRKISAAIRKATADMEAQFTKEDKERKRFRL